MDRLFNLSPTASTTRDSSDGASNDIIELMDDSCPEVTLHMDNVSSQDLRFLDESKNSLHIDFNGYAAEQLYGDASIPTPTVPMSSNTQDSSDAACHELMDDSCPEVTLHMDNVSSQDLRFLDEPKNSLHIDFNGYVAEQLYGDGSIPTPTVPASTSTNTQDSNEVLESPHASHNQMVGSGLKERNNSFTCTICNRNFSRNFDLKRHIESVHEKIRMQCDVCKQYFTRKDTLLRHKKLHENRPEKRASESKQITSAKKVKSNSSVAAESTSNVLPIQTEGAFNDVMRTYKFNNDEGFLEIKYFLEHFKQKVIDTIETLARSQEFKVNFRLFCLFEKGLEGDFVEEVKCFKTRNKIILPSTDLSEFYMEASEKLQKEATEFQEKDSGWRLIEIKYLELRVNRYNPLRASSYIELPLEIQKKHAIINVQNHDTMCFKWAVLSALYPADAHADRISNYTQYGNTLNFQGITFPVTLTDISKFEKLNSIGINVFHLNDKIQVCPLRMCEKEFETVIDLLYLKKDDKSHYTWIKNMSRLISSQLSRKKSVKFICRRCLSAFGTAHLLNEHKILCSDHDAARVVMPGERDKMLKFTNVKHQQMIPFIIVADFEALTKKIVNPKNCEPDASSSYSMLYQKHEAICFAYYIIYQHGLYKPPVVYRGEDATKKFLEMLVQEAKEIELIYKSPKPMGKLSEDQKKRHSAANECYLCSEKFTKENWKVFDHCHIRGEYRGPACNNCNLKLKLPHFIPVFFHNLSGYDGHFIVKELGFDEKKISVVAENEEKYIYFSKTVGKLQLRFLDSFRFMSFSLERLASDLNKDDFKYMKSFFPQSKVHLLLRKGIFPYDYMDDVKKFEQTVLPDKEQFYSILNETEISDEDYSHAIRVWEEFKIKNLGEYTELYIKTDVLLLADILTAFRKSCFKSYDLDMAWYFTAPGLSWDAMLKYTKVNIELLTDYEKLMFVEKGIRGGISQCSHRYATANNRFMPNFKSNEKESYLLYLDANNLYGWAMGEPLPLKDFQWCDSSIDVEKIPDDAETGYILEVDLKYPYDLHDQHNEYPLAPVSEAPPFSKEKRLLLTLDDKSKYVVHYRNLKFYIKHGLQISKVHRILQFTQKPFLKMYISHNTNLRTEADNEFERTFYKLMNNSVFGKCMEDVRRRRDIRLCSNAKTAEKLIAKPNFRERTIFSENLAAVHLQKTEVVFKKPITIGMAVLDISKTLMYNFYYEFMKPNYDDFKLLYTDTDSFIFLINTDNIYDDIKKNIENYDTSDYSENNAYEIPRVNKKKLGLMKDECKGAIMTEFAATRSKVYSFNVLGKSKPKKKLKGIKKHALKRIGFDDFKKCVLKKTQMLTTMQTIRSIKHDIYSSKQNKLALSPYDEKRFICDDGISTLAWGHYKISSLK